MPKKKKVRITGYYRVSTKSEAQKSSFEFQPFYFQSRLEETRFKDTHERVEKFYCDYGTSGTGFLNRDGFIEMLEDAGLNVTKIKGDKIPHRNNPNILVEQIKLITTVNPNKKPKFDEIWCKSTSRFARNINAYDIILTLLDAGVYVYFLDKELHSKNENDLIAIRDCFVEDSKYSEKLSRDILISKENFKRQNIVTGKTFGYIYHKRERLSYPYYTLHPKHSKTVEKIFDYCIEGLGNEAISTRLMEENLFNEKGKPIGPSTVAKILSNEKYMGYNTVGKYTTGKLYHKLKGPTIVEGYEQNLKKTDAIPPIVSEEKFYAAQEARKSRKINPKDKHSVGRASTTNEFTNLYKKILVCGYCGSHFIYDNNGGNGYFECSTKSNYRIRKKRSEKTKNSKAVQPCDCNNVYKNKLDAFLEDLQNGGLHFLIETDFINSITSLISLIELYLNVYIDPTKITEYNEQSGLIQKELESKIQFRDNLITMLTSSPFSESGFKKFQEQIETLETEISELENQLKVIDKTPNELDEKLTSLFEITFKEINLVESKKETYTREELFSIIKEIQVYGKTKNSMGGLSPEPIFVALIDVIEQASGLIEAGEETIKYKLKDAIPDDYEAPLHFIQNKKKTKPIPTIHPIDDTHLTKEEREVYFKYPTKGKMELIESKRIINTHAYLTPEGELGYIADLGLENKSIMQQIKDYTYKLYNIYLKNKEKSY